MASRIAVIGSNSFSGAHCVDGLLARPGASVVGISRSPEKSDLFLPYKSRNSSSFRFFQKNVNSQLDEILRILDEFRPETIINFAAQGEVATSWKHPEHWFTTNALGVVGLANALVGRKYLKRYIHISTPEVYGSCDQDISEDAPLNPSTPYAASKAAGDLFLGTLVKQYRFPLLMIRSTNVYGKHQQLYRIIPRAIIEIKKGAKIQLHGGGVARKAYLHIRDVIGGILLAMDKGREGHIYHLSPADDVSVRDLVSQICGFLSKSFESSAENVAERPGQDASYRISSEKARRELGWAPSVGLADGIREMIAWIEAEWERIRSEPTQYRHEP